MLQRLKGRVAIGRALKKQKENDVTSHSVFLRRSSPYYSIEGGGRQTCIHCATTTIQTAGGSSSSSKATQPDPTNRAMSHARRFVSENKEREGRRGKGGKGGGEGSAHEPSTHLDERIRRTLS